MGRFLAFLSVLLDLLAAGCTYLWGAIVIPNVFNLALWLLDNLGRILFYLLSWRWLPHLPILPFPIHLAQMAVTRNRSWGLLWLGLYAVTRASFLWESPVMLKFAPANAFHPNETRWTLVKQCLQQYRKALDRFLTPPIKLRIPPLQYEERAENILITWQGHRLIIPTSLLTAREQSLLAPLLALELARYNSADLFVRALMSTYPYRRPSRWLAWAGIFFWLPTSIIRSRLYKNWCKQQELAYDEFAYLCGQGEALLCVLQAGVANQAHTLATDYEPSTLERIGHLEALLRAEYEQMTKLGLAVPNLPSPLLLPPATNALRENRQY